MLHRNRLDLGAWFGFQEVYLADPVHIERVAFRVCLEHGAHVTAFLDSGGAHVHEGGSTGFRLSRHDAIPPRS